MTDWTEINGRDGYAIDSVINPTAKGEILTKCPKCSQDRKKKNQKCLSLNVDKGTGLCHHCGTKFVRADHPDTCNKYKQQAPAIIPTQINPRPLNDSELSYWEHYHIIPHILEVYGVKALDNYQIGNKLETSEPANPIFCYHAEGKSYKIYRPHATDGQNKFCWINGKPENYYFGKKFCTGSERVIIAAGEKDVLTVISSGGPEAFTLNSETADLPEVLLKQLKTQYKEVIVLYDNDQTGIERSKNLCKKYGLIRGILPDGIKDVSDLIKAGRSFDEIRYEYPAEEEDFFACKTANQWLEESKKLPPSPQLFGPFITKGELTILFSDPSAGKSAIIAQIAENLCRGLSTMGLKNESKPLIVLYIDFELSPKQWEMRNSDQNGKVYQFSPNFYRAELNTMADANDSDLEKVIFSKIEKQTNRLKADVIIIDNISWLHSEADKAKFAVPLMRNLKKLVKKQGLTVIVINHTIKRDESRAITANDMAGSKQIRALADMIWTIGKASLNKNIRYLKMLKDNRTTGEIYGPDNVLVCELTKTDRLIFTYLTEAREADYLPRIENREPNPKEYDKIAARVLSQKDLSNTEIGKIFKVGESTIRNWLKQD